MELQETNNTETSTALTTYEYGQYFRYTENTSELDANFVIGEIYPIVSMATHHISNLTHNVTLLIPKHVAKSDSVSEVKITTTTLEHHFTPVSASQAQTERNKLLSDLNLKVKCIQQDLSNIIESPQSALRLIASDTNTAVIEARNKLDLSVPSLPNKKGTSLAEVMQSSESQPLSIIRKQLENQKHLGEVISVYSKEKQKELAVTMSFAASIKEEEARAASGMANSMLERVSDVDDKLEQLSLYMGEGVEVHTISEGDVSTQRSKFKIFSHLIYCDEEMLTHNIFNKGTFDKNDLPILFEHIASNKSFRERLLPAERCIVVARPRRKDKIYDSEQPLINMLMNRGNFDTFTLIRDGERISVVYSPIKTQHRLFPTESEMNSFFKHVSGVDDVSLTDAQKSLKKLNDTYTKFSAVLQGILDRQELGETVVFGELPIHQPRASFFDPHLLAQNIDFINDEDYLLGANGEMFDPAKWIRKHFVFGDETKAGDVVYCHSDMIHYHTAQDLFSKRKDHDGDYSPLWYQSEPEASELKIVCLNDRLEPSVKVSVEQFGAAGKARQKNATVELYKKFIRLNLIKPSELDRILQSRFARPLISEIINPLTKAREDIRETLYPNCKALIEAYESAYPSPERCHEQVYQYVMHWASLNQKSPLKPIPVQKAAITEIHHIELNHFELDSKAIAKIQTQKALAVLSDGLQNYLLEENNAEFYNEHSDSLHPVFAVNETEPNPIYATKLYEVGADLSLSAIEVNSNLYRSLKVIHEYERFNVDSKYYLQNCNNDLVIPIMKHLETIKSSSNTKLLDTIRTYAQIEKTAIASKSDQSKAEAIRTLLDELLKHYPKSKRVVEGASVTPSIQAPVAIGEGRSVKYSLGDFTDSITIEAKAPVFVLLSYNLAAAALSISHTINCSTAKSEAIDAIKTVLKIDFRYTQRHLNNVLSDEDQCSVELRTYLSRSMKIPKHSGYYRDSFSETESSKILKDNYKHELI